MMHFYSGILAWKRKNESMGRKLQIEACSWGQYLNFSSTLQTDKNTLLAPFPGRMRHVIISAAWRTSWSSWNALPGEHELAGASPLVKRAAPQAKLERTLSLCPKLRMGPTLGLGWVLCGSFPPRPHGSPLLWKG